MIETGSDRERMSAIFLLDHGGQRPAGNGIDVRWPVSTRCERMARRTSTDLPPWTASYL